MDIVQQIMNVKKSSFTVSSLSQSIRNKALEKIITALRENRKSIFEANMTDLKNAKSHGLPSPITGRLKFDSHKLEDCISGIESLIELPDPVSRTLLKRQLDHKLILTKVTCPIGVIGVIFESRPDALVQIASLCIKSGNCAILKGGSEARHTNRVLFETIYNAALKAGMPDNFAMLIEDRAGIDEVLKCDKYVDLIIPRGSNAFVEYIMNNSHIPVMGHADGICHIYVDAAADINTAIPVVIDSKTQYAAACNAVETLLVHKSIATAFIPALAAVSGNSIEYLGDEECMKLISCSKSTEDDFRREYLDTILLIKTVDSIEDAIDHINTYGSHHTDCIITEDKAATDKFMSLVDSAGVYHNCSTRFADGFRYGFGAEVGISTGKLHARGPVGLEGLVTYKYKLMGNGQIVGDYADHKSQFHFKDL